MSQNNNSAKRETMDTGNDDSSISMITLRFQNEDCRVIANTKCIVIEPLATPNLRTIIPLDQVISVRGCSCKKTPKKRLTCSCIYDQYKQFPAQEETHLGTEIGTSPSTSPSGKKGSNSGYIPSQIKAVKIFYAVAVGDFRWKVTFVTLRRVKSENDSDRIGVLNWTSSVSSIIEGLKRPRKLLFFINPFGGKRQARKIFETKVEPILKISGLDYETIITERANHARDMIQNVDIPLKDFDGFICVGGDGMFAELINGILIRSQTENQIDFNNSKTELAQPTVPIGVIPAGSTDAVAFGVTGVNDPVTSIIHVLFGHRVDIDVSAIHSISDGDVLLRYATSFLGYGYFGDVLMDSERNRWMGPSRYDWAGLKKFIALKRYEGEIKLYASNVDGSPRDKSICQANCSVCSKSGQKAKYEREVYLKNGKHDINTGEDGDISCVTIKGKFLAVNCATMSCRCDKSKKGMSPSAHLGNGCCDLILVSETSRLNYLRFLMRTGFLATSAFDLPFVDVYRVKEFEYYPSQEQENSVWNCDGEVISQPALRVKIHCQLLPVFGAGRENRHLNQSRGIGLKGARDLKKKHNSKPDAVVLEKLNFGISKQRNAVAPTNAETATVSSTNL